jgi:phage terminase large subunit-like protein
MTRRKRSTPSRVTSASSASRRTAPKVPPPRPSASGRSFKSASIGSLNQTKLNEIYRAILEPEDLATFLYDWRVWGRPTQVPPAGDWRIWLLMAGRGFGKTRTGAEWVRMQAESERAGRIALVGPTASAVRDVMIEGESGVLAIAHPHFRPEYRPTRLRLEWPNGALALGYSAEEPNTLRGPQFDAAWCDELAAWRYPEAWDNLLMGLRLGSDPRVVVTTTPKPTRLIRELVRDRSCVVTRGSTRENRSNLAPSYLSGIVKRYEGTRLGRQELEAELLEDTPGALWTRELLETARVIERPVLRRAVVAIDPAVSAKPGADETGLIVAALGNDGLGYVLQDASGHYRAEDWARRAVALYQTFQADRIIGEVNNGGDLVEATLRAVDRSVSYKAVRASRGKAVRAEPVAALYEQGRVKHHGGFPALEDQMCRFAADLDRAGAGESPDRVDALVWALTELMIEPSGTGLLDYYAGLVRERKAQE